jgi:predicted phage terminase large subunit-like protein
MPNNFTKEDIDDLVDETTFLEEEELTPREERKIEFRNTIERLYKLQKILHLLEPEDRAAALELFDSAERVACELSLATFFKMAWPHMDTAEYKHNWHIDVIADAAEKLITGESRRLIVNQPPRTGKSNLLAVALPAWIWAQSEKGPLSGPQVKFMFGSYGQALSYNHSALCRNLIMSNWYQHHWGHRYKLKEDRNAIGFFENDKGGARIATSVGAALTGLGADFIGIDDPHNTQDVVSQADRDMAWNWYSQSVSTRLNDPKTGVMLLVMQRQHEDDLTGKMLNEEADLWDHVVFRMRYEENPSLPYDIRTEEGELLWEERIPEVEVLKLERTLGTYGTAGQLQQRPQPKGGGIIKADFWGLYPPKGQEEDFKKDGVVCWPPFEFLVASLDGAYTEKEENDPSALTIWGLWWDKLGVPRVIAVHAWEEFLSINKLVMRVGNNCRKFKIDVLLIEAKASGISAAQEIQRLFGNSDWTTVLCPVKGDKVARAISVQGIFEDGTVLAPDREWAQLLIDRCASFPKGKRKDLVDSTTQALRWMRDNGMIKRREERLLEQVAALPRPGDSVAEAPPYDV